MLKEATSMARHIKRHWSGFTIVELLIVIVVIGILAAISVVAYIGIRGQAQTAAHKQDVSQAERQILAYAALAGGDANGVTGALVGYQEGVGTKTLLRPLTGTPDITTYLVCSVISITPNYTGIVELSPSSSSAQVFRLQNGIGGGDSMGYRIDTTAQLNAGSNVGSIRIPGSSIIG
jgi:general secretion pathway protein G